MCGRINEGRAFKGQADENHFEKMTVSRMVQKCATFYENREFFDLCHNNSPMENPISMHVTIRAGSL